MCRDRVARKTFRTVSAIPLLGHGACAINLLPREVARPLIGVFWDYGSIGMADLAHSAEGLADLAFVIDRRSPYGASAARLASHFGTVVDAPVADHDLSTALASCDGLATFADSQIVRMARIAELLGLPQHSPQTALAPLTDKHERRRRLAAAGIPTPVHALLTAGCRSDECLRHAATVPFPAVLKPRRGTASRNTWRLDHGAHLAAIGELCEATPGSLLPEDYVVEQMRIGDARPAPYGHYVSVEVASSDAVHHPIDVSVPSAGSPAEGGLFVPDELSRAERSDVIDLADAALDALGVVWGVSHTQVTLTADGPRIIEVNGRLGGFADAVYRKAGLAEVARDALLCALGRPPEPVGLATQTAAVLLFPMPLGGPPPRRDLARAAGRLRRVPGSWRVETPVPGPGGSRVDDGTMSSPLTAWIDTERVRLRQVVESAVREVTSELGSMHLSGFVTEVSA